MKVAAAVLGVSLLFFLGVLTGAGRRGSVAPPGTITLGVVQPGSPSAPAGGGPSSPASPAGKAGRATTTTKPASASTPTTASNPSSAAGSGGSGPAGSSDTGSAGTSPTGPSGETTTATGPAEPSSTSTTAPPGQVQPVDNQVDCAQTGKRGKGHRTPCPSTTATTSATPNGNWSGGGGH
ncbi:MAG: hypothetical protein QOF96_1900 [Actinomycetota bacterium]|nr:hypothetical protein [Actinomycetota bacterium]